MTPSDLDALLEDVEAAQARIDAGTANMGEYDALSDAAPILAAEVKRLRDELEEARLTLAAEQGRQEGAPDTAWTVRMSDAGWVWTRETDDGPLLKVSGGFGRPYQWRAGMYAAPTMNARTGMLEAWREWLALKARIDQHASEWPRLATGLPGVSPAEAATAFVEPHDTEDIWYLCVRTGDGSRPVLRAAGTPTNILEPLRKARAAMQAADKASP